MELGFSQIAGMDQARQSPPRGKLPDQTDGSFADYRGGWSLGSGLARFTTHHFR